MSRRQREPGRGEPPEVSPRSSRATSKLRRRQRGGNALGIAARPPMRRSWLVGLGACLLAAVVVVGFYRHEGGSGYPLDDSWIHLTFARHLARGEGFGANPHQSTPGATSPLWVVLLAAGFLLGADHSVWPWFLAALLLGTAAFLCSRIIVEARRRAAEPPHATLDLCALLCGLTVALLGPLVWSAAGAMEVPLFSALVAATLLAFARRDATRRRDALAWGGLVGLAALARPEGLLLAPILALTEVVHRRRDAVLDVALALLCCAVVYSPSALFCLASSGRLYPNTFYAKTTALVSGPPDARFWLDFIRFLIGVSPVTLLALVLGLATLGRTLVTPRSARSTGARPMWAVALFALGLPFAYSLMGRTFLFAGFAGNFGRYLYPMMPCALVLGFWGTEVLVTALGRRWVAAGRWQVPCLLEYGRMRPRKRRAGNVTP